jgi:hypothetical protein
MSHFEYLYRVLVSLFYHLSFLYLMSMKFSFSIVYSFLIVIVYLDRLLSLGSETTGPVVKELNGQQILGYIQEMNNTNFFSLIVESYSLKMNSNTGISKTELSGYIAGINDPDLKHVLENLVLLGDGGSVLTVDSTTSTGYQKSLAVFGKRPDNKYDILVVHATQEKKLGTDKLIAGGAGSVCAGILVGTVTMNPAIGAITTVVLASGTGLKATYDYSKEMPDVVLGYILQELIQRDIMKILPDNRVQFIIRQ